MAADSLGYEVKNNVPAAVPMPVVSIRTVTFNHAAYIRDCIEGVLRQQTSFPVEYIIGEDCSTDGTREIVMEYARAYPDIIRVLTADQNVGAAQNAHRCRQACRGKYVALCEGDDHWTDPYKLQKQVDFLESHPDFSGIGSDFCRIDERGGLIKANVVKFHHLKQDGEGNYLASRRLLPGSGRYYPSYTGTLTMLYRNLPGIPERMQGFRHIPNTDWVLFMLMLEQGKIGFLKEITAAYRLHPQGMYSSIGKFRQQKMSLDTTKYFIRTLKQSGRPFYFDHRALLIRVHLKYWNACLQKLRR